MTPSSVHHSPLDRNTVTGGSVRPTPTSRASDAELYETCSDWFHQHGEMPGRERLGEDVAHELVDWYNAVDATYRNDLRELNELNFQRFDATVEQRFARADADVERRFAEFRAEIERRLAEWRVETSAA